MSRSVINGIFRFPGKHRKDRRAFKKAFQQNAPVKVNDFPRLASDPHLAIRRFVLGVASKTSLTSRKLYRWDSGSLFHDGRRYGVLYELQSNIVAYAL